MIEWNIRPLYPIGGFVAAYLVVMFLNPIRPSLRDGFRCINRFKRIPVSFILLGFAYFVFQFATFTPIQQSSDLDFSEVFAPDKWVWPSFLEVWPDVPLPTLEGVAGIFDNATTTYPLSVIAALLIFVNWRGLHGVLFGALRKRYRFWSYLIYSILLLGALASLLKPIMFWRLPAWGALVAAPELLQISAAVDAVAFIFEYLFGIYVQVYLITVCLAWVKGLSFEQGELLRFAMRRFSYVLEWSGIIVVVSTLMIRAPLLLAYFMDIPNVLDYLPAERALMSVLIILFCSVQISLTLHNESLGAAIRAHWAFVRRNLSRLGWFLIICAVHFFFITVFDAVARGAIAHGLMA